MMCAKSVLVAASVGVIGISQVQAQTSDWTGPTNGNWNVAANWNPAAVPAGAAAFARIDSFGGNIIANTALPSIAGIELIDASTVLLDPGSLLSITGPSSINNGVIQLNRFGSALNSVLSIDGEVALAGSGEIQMRTSTDNAQISGSGLLTQGSSHTIRGVGRISVPLVNGNRVAADSSVSVSGSNLQILADVQNDATLAAAASSTLEIEPGVTVTQANGASIVAEGGIVQLEGGSTVINGSLGTTAGGSVTTSGTPVMTLDSVMSSASPFIVAPSTNVDIVGAGLLNDGLVRLNPIGSSANAVVRFAESGTLTGAGEMQLSTSGDNAQLTTAASATITHVATHTIRGVGQVSAAMNNAGTVSADVSVSVSGNILDLFDNDKTNSGLFSAESGSVLEIDAITVDQAGGGLIRSNAGQVRFAGDATVLHGAITSDPGGIVSILGGSTTTLDGTSLDANLFVDPSGTLAIGPSGIENDGTVTFNNTGSSANAVLEAVADVTIDGNGVIRMRSSGDNSQVNTAPGFTISHGAAHTIRGVGQVNAAMVNNGRIVASVADSVSGNRLELQGENKLNANEIASETGSILDIDGITLAQTPGASIAADEGIVEIRSTARIEGGTLSSTGSGVIRTFSGSTSELSDVVIEALLQIDPGTTVTVDSAGLVNNGLVEVNRFGSSADAVLRLSDATIAGTGEIQLRTGFTNAFITTAPGTTGTLGAGQLVRGVGDITGAIVNNGEFRADASVSVSGSTMVLSGEDKVNNGDLVAVNATTLSINGVSIDQSSGGTTIADGGTVVLAGDANIVGGTLGSVNGGVWQTSTGGFNVDGALLTGAGTINPGHTMDVVGGTLMNDADIGVNPQFSAADGVIAIDQSTLIAGGGSIDLITSGDNSRIASSVGDGVTLTNGSGHRITGDGQIQVPLINNGIVQPGRPNGSLEVFGDTTLTAGGTLRVIHNTTGVLDVSGEVSIAGALELVPGAPLQNNQNQVIVQADSIDGVFDTSTILTEGPLVVRVVYEPDRVVLRTRCRADTNLDGSVDPADFNAWIIAFNNRTSPADQNLDGIISPADFNAWIINFNNGCL
jgi:hypothetical protein